MPCTEVTPRRRRPGPRPHRGLPLPAALCGAIAVALAGCAGRPPATPTPTPPAATATAAAATESAPRFVELPAPPAARDWDELKLNAARRLVAAHPDTSYMGTPPEPLLGIPVLEVELNADGSVRHIKVLREPREAKETIQMAIDAVRRAAPYGDVSRLPRPWRFVEVFLFDDEHRFKPATLDR